MTTARQPWPTKLRFQKGAGQLVVDYDDGVTVRIPYPRLRAESPSANVRGHGAGPGPSKAPVPSDISVEKAEPVGRYAVRIFFSDGHSNGYYTWAYLRQLGSP